MDPISFSIELELGQLIIGLAGLLFTYLHHQDTKARYHQRERHHRESLNAYNQAQGNHRVPPAPASPSTL